MYFSYYRRLGDVVEVDKSVDRDWYFAFVIPFSLALHNCLDCITHVTVSSLK